MTTKILQTKPTSSSRPGEIYVNDVHSKLNRTRVESIINVQSAEEVRRRIAKARYCGKSLSVAGGRHSMGGQQFGEDTWLLDMRPMNRILKFDQDLGVVEAEAGIHWPELMGCLRLMQGEKERQWGIIQKQTGADQLTLGGAVASNIHGRGLKLRPFIRDIESLTLIDAEGELRVCSRRENPELFRLVVGGYGLFGVVVSVKLRLGHRRKVMREVEMMKVDNVIPAFQRKIDEGSLYGDFQFCCDENSEDFLQKGIFATYRPVANETPIPPNQLALSEAVWLELVQLAAARKSEAFERYAWHYLSTAGQLYWSDIHQLSTYREDFYDRVTMGKPGERSTLMISELYVPREELVPFLCEVREDFRRNQVDLIYGTVRLIERDTESFLAWAKEPWACVVFNLNTVHTPEGLQHSSAAFRRLIDLAIQHRGSYYLTYHRHATRFQTAWCYPQMPEFLSKKLEYDSHERFQSEWYRHQKAMFLDVI